MMHGTTVHRHVEVNDSVICARVVRLGARSCVVLRHRRAAPQDSYQRECESPEISLQSHLA